MSALLAFETWEYLTEFAFARHAFVAALCTATAAAALSGIVVLKRLAFVGQGISHAAFGGIGVAAILGMGAIAGELVIFLFCVGSALLIAALSGRKTQEDTAIGIVLVGTMALGFLLLGLRSELIQHEWYREFLAGSPTPAGWESILFGSVTLAGERGMWMSIGVMVIVLSAVWWFRRPLLCYAFDETAATAAGVSTARMRALLMVLLALIVVVGMKLVGVVLISAMLVLPGAIAIHVARTLAGTLAVTWAAAIVGVVGGLVIAFETGLQSGPCIVLVLVGLYMLAAGVGVARR
jgi:ABC-type Mn2+/Zn2+ transport system permease subunit